MSEVPVYCELLARNKMAKVDGAGAQNGNFYDPKFQRLRSCQLLRKILTVTTALTRYQHIDSDDFEDFPYDFDYQLLGRAQSDRSSTADRYLPPPPPSLSLCSPLSIPLPLSLVPSPSPSPFLSVSHSLPPSISAGGVLGFGFSTRTSRTISTTSFWGAPSPIARPLLIGIGVQQLGVTPQVRLNSSTLHPTSYILHPTAHTLHSTLPTPYTLHPEPYTLHPFRLSTSRARPV